MDEWFSRFLPQPNASTPFGQVTSNVRNLPMLIREHFTRVVSGNTTYIVHVCGQERANGNWEGWIEFHPTDASQPILSTERETSQPNRTALEYWADGLEPIYLDGALARAQGRLL